MQVTLKQIFCRNIETFCLNLFLLNRACYLKVILIKAFLNFYLFVLPARILYTFFYLLAIYFTIARSPILADTILFCCLKSCYLKSTQADQHCYYSEYYENTVQFHFAANIKELNLNVSKYKCFM